MTHDQPGRTTSAWATESALASSPAQPGRCCSGRVYWTLLLAIACGAWALRLAVTERFVGLAAVPDRADGLDQIDYELFAYRLSVGAGYTLEDGTATARRAPGTSLVLLPAYLVCGRSYLAARLWFTFLSAATCVAAAWVVRRRCGEAAALLTALGVALDPGLFYYAVHIWSEPPFCLFATLAAGFSLRALERERGWHAAAAGLCWGLALLIRPQVLLVAPLAVLGLCLASPVRRRQWLTPLAVQFAVIGLVLAPWLVRNALVMGKPCLATLVGGHTFLGAHNEITFHQPEFRGSWIVTSRVISVDKRGVGSELEQEAYAWRLGLDCVAKNLPLLPRLLCCKVYRLVTPFPETENRLLRWAFAASWLCLAPLAVYGFWELRQRDRLLGQLIAMQVWATLACTLVFYGAARFRHALEPLLLMCAAVAVVALAERARRFASAQVAIKPELAKRRRAPLRV